MKFKINLFLRLFYLFVKSIVLVSFGVFYRKETSHNEHHFKTPGPCIIICNHPNTMVDVLHVAKKKKAIVHFIANAGMFSTAIGNWFFTTFFCIKVERPKDVDGRRINNADSFKKAADFLGRYGTLLIAAEGSSKLERRLRKIKTGGARIAFDTMQKNNWELPLKVLPAGITYEDPKKARYDLFFNFGESIDLLDYKEKYETDPARAVKQLTADIQASMQNLLLHTEPEDEDIDKMVQKLERIHKNEFGNEHAAQFFISKKWIDKLLDLKYNQAAEYESIKQKVNTYCDAITKHKLTDQAIQEKANYFVNWIGFIILSIPALLGWLNNIQAFHLPNFIMRKTGLYPGYTATVKILLAVFLFPLTYWLQFRLISFLLLYPYSYLIYLICIVVLGFIALFYSRKWQKHKTDIIWRKLKKQNTPLYTEIKQQRSEIISTVFSQLST